MKNSTNYSHLLRQRVVLLGLTLGLITIFLGVMIELAVSSQKTKIPPAVQRLILPLNPQLDVKTVEKIESYPPVTLDVARSELSRTRTTTPVPIEEAIATESAVVESPAPTPTPEAELPFSEAP
jgi:hypothetical protein